MESNRIKVTIFGQSYTINGEAPADYMMRLAQHLNDKMEEVRKNCGVSNPTHAAILAALNIADEYFQLKKSKSGSESEIERRTRALISMLDRGLIGEAFPRPSNAPRA